jgi:hypothetical protein
MRQETYRFAFDEANAELRDIMEQYEQLRSRKEQVEKVVAALQPFLALSGDPTAAQALAEETQYSFLTPETAIADLGKPEIATELQEFLRREGFVHEEESQPIHQSMTAEPEAEPETEAEPVAEMSSDPFQRRIDDVLRHGVGGQALRIHSRSLNGLLSRV